MIWRHQLQVVYNKHHTSVRPYLGQVSGVVEIYQVDDVDTRVTTRYPMSGN